MIPPTNPSKDFSPFLPSTFYVPEEEDRFREWIGKTFSEVSDVVNLKKIGTYIPVENQNGEVWQYDFTNIVRNGFQFILRIKNYPNTGSVTLPLPIIINPQFVVTHIWGSASLPPSSIGAGNGDFFSYMSQGNTKVSFMMSDLFVTVTTTVDLSAYTGFIVVEYIKNGF